MAERSVFVRTLGCKVNTFDSHALENQFACAGSQLAESADDASTIVINTCSVTANADREARYLIRRFRRDHPDCQLVVTGCYAQTDSARLAAMPEVDFVVPNEAKERLVEFISAGDRSTDESGKLPESVRAVSANRQTHFKSSLTLFDDARSTSRTRAFVKIQDGCNGFCAYCLIPYARGASRSVTPDLVLSEIARLISTGTREIVLTGIHIGDYGRDLPETEGREPFLDLLEKIFNLPNLGRIRISSLEPGELTEGLLQLAARHREHFCPHFHLPLQSGSDSVLKRMRRTYTGAEYLAACAMARQYFPGSNIGADVIPGFPQESAAEFEETIALIRAADLNYLHVFPYSPRPNTAAVRMPGHLDPGLIRERAKILRDLSTELSRAYATRHIGQTCHVLWEGDTDEQGRRKGLTDNYLTVIDGSEKSKTFAAGVLASVRLRGFVTETALLGR